MINKYLILIFFCFLLNFHGFCDNIYLNSKDKNLTLREFFVESDRNDLIYFGIDSKDDYNFRIIYEVIRMFKQRYSNLIVFSCLSLFNEKEYSNKVYNILKSSDIKFSDVSFFDDIKKKISSNGINSLSMHEKILIPYFEEDINEKKFYFEIYKDNIPNMYKFDMSLFENYYNSILIEKEFMANSIDSVLKKYGNYKKTLIILDKEKIYNGFGVGEKLNRRTEYSYMRIIPVYYEKVEKTFKNQEYSDILWIIKERAK